ncbi:hypothetical protein WMY93_023757 [Mugilogobius chulae]|uniref:Uncharacterized protein n=1 Tax=Mugilogobius chulae TaxID=88201 RepID=A0AAW0N553_9GOBI
MEHHLSGGESWCRPAHSPTAQFDTCWSSSQWMRGDTLLGLGVENRNAQPITSSNLGAVTNEDGNEIDTPDPASSTGTAHHRTRGQPLRRNHTLLTDSAGVWSSVLRAPAAGGAVLGDQRLRGADSVVTTGPRRQTHPAHHHLILRSSQQHLLAALEEQRIGHCSGPAKSHRRIYA